MSPLEAAQAEVDRLKLEAETMPFTKAKDGVIFEVLGLLGYDQGLYGSPKLNKLKSLEDSINWIHRSINSSDDGDFRTVNDRLNALEAAASKTISVTMPKVVESWGDGSGLGVGVAKDAPATVEETVAAQGTVRGDRIVCRTNPDRIVCKSDGDRIITDSPRTVAAQQSAETMPDQAFKTTILDRASIVFTKDGREAMLVEDFQRFVGNHMKQHSVDRATIQDREETVAAMMAENAELFDQSDADAATIATLNNKIATRDRLLDDQATTIGKLEAERNVAKDKLAMVLSRVDGMDLNNPDKMMGQRWVRDTGKNHMQVVYQWYGHDVLVSTTMHPVFLANLKETLSQEGNK